MTTPSYRIRGVVREATPPPTREVAVTGVRRLLPATAREAGVGEITAPADDVVRVELENGFVLWTRADDLIRERGRKSVSRDGDEGWEIDPRAPSDLKGSSRGCLGLGIRLLEFIGIDLKGKAARTIAQGFEARQLEGREPGLYRCDLGDAFDLSLVPGEEPLPPTSAPMLVFIHGTASSCRGSFGKLWEPAGAAGKAARLALSAHYGGRVWAWEHQSLTQSPIENALELARRLPDASEVHLVTHSRGGLVGELLCLGERDKGKDPLRDELIAHLFAADHTIAEQLGLSPLEAAVTEERDAAYAADREHLRELIALLDAKQLRIRRFVRVACPARGTTLASGRLDRWLSVVNHLMGNGLVGDAADFLLAVVKERTDPRSLPGLEAMLPGSALTRLLHHPGLTSASDLTVIAGDVEGDSLWAQIKLLATDWFFGADHDLVVNTGSMYGGLRRPEGAGRFLLDQGPRVNHFSYFDNEKSVRWLVAGLTRPEGSDGGFQPLREAKVEEPRWREAVRRSRASAAPRPLAVVLPGTMGSALKVQGEAVWLNYWSLLWGGLRRLRRDAAGVEPTDLLDDFYGPLLEFLARSHRVEIFPYDWRMSVIEAAKRLADRLEDLLPLAERANQPVHLVAHSMGGLIVRAMIADGGRGAALWRRIIALPNSRFMMLGTPNLGSYEAVRWLTGNNPTQAKLSLLDVTQSTDEIVNLVRAFPGLVELLPCDPDSPDFSRQRLWQELRQALRAGWKPADEAVLRQARATWQLLRTSPSDPEHMIYVAGHQRATVADYRLADYEEDYLAGRQRIEFVAVRQGDGTVTWKSGFLPGVPVWYVEDTAHDALCTQKRALPGYLDLLMTGRTSRLSTSPPTRARAGAGEPERFTLPATPPTDDIPDELAVRRLSFGPGSPPEAAEAGPTVPVIQVSVRHGDLAYARHPVLVGHYIGDIIVSAEAALDKRLDKALSRRMELGLYPGAPRTHAVFFNEDPSARPAGAIVVGLGQVGELSTTLLQTGVRDALLDYALQVAHWPDERFGAADGVRSAAVSCLLVGSGPGGVTIRESVEAILRGAVAANERLARAQLDDRVLIDRLAILELYEDRALAAAQALDAVLADGQLADAVRWQERAILEGQGRQRRVHCDDTPGWWHRLEIIEEQGTGGLRFIASTDRARAEVTQATGQLELADGFIREASRTPSSNAEVAKTLFEMLLPNRLKELAPRQDDVVLLVDERSARYPWELLEDRWSQTGMPPSVRSGLVRQLKTREFRPRPAHASAPTAYVVGNPDLGGWQQFPDLPGAREEARKVATVLREAGYRVRDSIDEKADAILDGLHRDAWRILHLAGHGEHDFPLDAPQAGQGKCCSGMVIGERTFLTPGDVEQMRWVPELVFINCCHLGKTQSAGHGRYSELAANLGLQFVRMGVKAVVAAGWAVDDAASNAFAVSFYSHLLRGETFGEAVRAAREEIWAHFPNVNTWGAYQCYGEPGYRLYGEGVTRPRPGKRYHAPAELVADLDNYTEWIRVQVKDKGEDPEVLEDMRAGIVAHFADIPDEQRDTWLARADVAAAVGFAWGETGAWEEGADWLNKALHAQQGDCPIRAVEQCANYRVRLSGQRWQALRTTGGTESERQALVQDIEEAIRELDIICQRAPTPERLSLLGSACKRLAWVHADEGPRREALVNMANYYDEAMKRSREPDPHPFSNWAVARLCALALDPTQAGGWQVGLDEQCRHMIDVARSRNAHRPNFWDGVAEADCELVRLLNRPDIAAEEAAQIAANIARLYRTVAARGASPREYDSVLEHLDFVIALAGHATGTPLGDALAAIRAAL
jgi:CHAT domain-containing protein